MKKNNTKESTAKTKQIPLADYEGKLETILVANGYKHLGMNDNDTIHYDPRAVPISGEIVLVSREKKLQIEVWEPKLQLATVGGKRAKDFKPMPTVYGVVKYITQSV